MNYGFLASPRRLCYLTTTVLRRFRTEPGKAFACVFSIPLERCRGNTIPSPEGVNDRRCAFPEVPLAFDLQNASHHQYALACGYSQSTTIPERARPVQVFMVTALGCSLGLCNLAWVKHNACCVYLYLPVADHCFQPDLPIDLRSHCCNRPKRLLNDLHCMDCSNRSRHGDCHTPFTVSLRLIRHTVLFT